MEMREDNLVMQNYWLHLRHVYNQSSNPALTLYHDIDVIDGWGFPVQNGTPIVRDGEGFGWGVDALAHMADKYAGTNLFDLPEVEGTCRPIDVLLSFPGSYTYGHWPIDIVSRIERALQIFSIQELAFIVPGPHYEYAKFFLKSFDIPPEALIIVPDRHRYKSRTLVIPFMRTTDYLPSDPFSRSFARIKKYGLELKEDILSCGEKIFVTHRAQSSIGRRATLSNAAEIESTLTKLGFRAICPADMTIPEQISAFASAKVIVGEDSSALHNIIYSSSAKLVVLNSSARKNMLHLSVCKLLEHDCEYIFYEDSEGGFTADSELIRDVVQNDGLLLGASDITEAPLEAKRSTDELI